MKKLLAAIGSAGAFTVYHNCGGVPCCAELCPDAWNGRRPRAGQRPRSAKAALGKGMTLIGNLDQVSFLASLLEEIARGVERTVSARKSGDATFRLFRLSGGGHAV